MDFQATLHRATSKKALHYCAELASLTGTQSYLKLIQKALDEDDFENEDILDWLPVLTAFDKQLEVCMPRILHVNNPDLHEVDLSAKELVCSILQFFCLLMKSARDKRYFLLFDRLLFLMRAHDMEIAEMAINVLFLYCIPTSSIAHSLQDEWYDVLEVPDNIAQEAFAYFEGLSLMSTELGVMDYLHNHEPKFLVQNSEILTITLPKSDRRPAGATLDLAVTTINDQTQKIIPVGEKESLKQLLSLKQQYQLVPDELTTLINIQRAVKGYRSSLDYRMRVASMRMKTFFILIHGRLEGPTIRVKEYVQVDSLFMKDVIEMSDLNSEYMAELPQNIAVDLATVAVENVLGLLENKLRRRNGTVVQSQIMLMLGLTRSESATFAVSSQEDPWMAIISSACSALSTMIDHKALSSSKPTASADLNDSADYKSLSRFVRLGLEMFVLSISCRDIMTAFSENNNTMISSVVTLIQTAQPELVDILKRSKTSSSGISQTFSVYDDQILRVITKALLCLELTLEKNGVIAAFRECDGLAPVKVVIELFMDALSAGGTFEGTAASSASSILDRFDTASKTVLEKSLSVLFVSIQKGRQASVMGITSDSGLTIASDAHFTNLCSAIFQSKYDTNEVLWTDIVMILKEVIDQDPSFLKLFISSLYASDLSKALTFVDGNLPNTFDGCSGSELQELLTPLMKLCHVISITGEGRQYLENSSIVVFILKVIIDPAVLLPKSPPIPIERLTKIGRMLSQLLMDCDLVSPIIKVLLRDSLVSLCVQAKSMYEVVNVRGDTDYDSPRNLLQQKLTNICQLVESMFSENRRQYGDLLRDILQEPVIEALVQAYPCSVATSQQLLAQLSLKNNITFGSNPCSRAISFLVKLAVSSIPQIVLPLLYKEIDNTLSKIGTTKALLESTSAQEDQQSLVVSSSNKDQSESIILVGVLKYIPHLCVIDPQLEAVMPLEKELQIWRLLVSILTVDWLSMLLSHALRSVQRLPGSNFVITNGKDVLRRLFAFHRSSALEIARFAASKWTPKEITKSREKRPYLDGLAFCNTAEDSTSILRRANLFCLRVSAAGGALIREGIEIEGSRIVLSADVGTTLKAYERKINSTGVVRYRTSLGWLSEFRRDHQKTPVVELLQILATDKNLGDDELNGKNDYLSELFTLRESVCSALIRSQDTLRQVAVYLSRAMIVVDPSPSRLSGAIGHAASVMSLSLTNIVKSFFTNPLQYIGTMESEELKLFEEDISESLPSLTRGQSKSSVKRDLRLGDSGKDLSKAALLKLIDVDDSAASSGSANTDFDVDTAALCIYFGSIVKNIVGPIIEDKNGNLNLVLLRTFLNHGILQALLDSFSFLVGVLKNELDSLYRADGLHQKMLKVGVAGQAALHSIPKVLTLLKKILNRELFSKSATNAAMLVDEIGPYQPYELLYSLLSTSSKKLCSLFENHSLCNFPSEIQSEWLAVMGELTTNLLTPLPAPKDGLSSSRNWNRERFDTNNRFASRREPLSEASSWEARERALSESVHASPRGFPWPALVPRDRSMRENAAPLLPPQPTSETSSAVPAVQNLSEENDVDAELLAAIRMSMEPSSAVNGPQIEENTNFMWPTLSGQQCETGEAEARLQQTMNNTSESRNANDGLPNLVADLDTAFVDEARLTVTSDRVEQETVQNHSSSEPVDYALEDLMSLVRERIADTSESESADADPVAMLGSVMGRRLDSRYYTAHGARSSGPGRRYSPPRSPSNRKLNSGKLADVNDSLHSNMYDSFSSKVEKLKLITGRLMSSLSDYVLHSCKQYSFVMRWDESVHHYLLPLLCDFLVKANKEARILRYEDLFQQLRVSCKKEIEMSDSSKANMFGYFLFINLLLKDLAVRKELDRSLHRRDVVDVLDVVLETINGSCNEQNNSWPDWLSPALLVIYDLLQMPGTPESIVDNDSSTKAEEKVEGKLIETKGEIDGTTEISTIKGLETKTFDASNMFADILLLPEQSREIIFGVTICMLQKSDSNRPLDDATAQVLLLILGNLLGSQGYADRFVAKEGVQSLLSLCYLQKKNDYNASKMITIVVAKCLETTAELRQSIALEIEQVFKAHQERQQSLESDSPERGNFMLLEKFLSQFNRQLMRSPEDFWAACSSVVKFEKVAEKEKADKQVSFSDKKPQYYVKLKRDVKSILATLDVGDDDRAYKTIQIIATHIFSAVKKVHPNNESTVESKLGHPVWAVLEALSDSVLSLKRVPMLLVKILKSDEDFCRVKASDNFIELLIRRFFSNFRPCDDSEKALTAIGNGDQNLWAATRLILALCAFRGVSRVFAIKSIVKVFKSCLTTKSEIIAEVWTTDERRVTVLTRIVKLLSLAIHTSKSDRRDVVQDQQGVSIDTIFYLVTKVDLLTLLVSSLNYVDLNQSSVMLAVTSVLELLEVLTRPKLKPHLEKMREIFSFPKGSASVAMSQNTYEDSADNVVDVHLSDPYVSNIQADQVQPNFQHYMPNESFDEEEEIYEEDEEDEEDEEQHEEQNEDDQYSGSDDDHSDDSSPSRSSSSNSDDLMGIENHSFIEGVQRLHMQHMGDTVGDDYVNVDSFQAPTVAEALRNRYERFGFAREEDNMRGGNVYITPPTAANPAGQGYDMIVRNIGGHGDPSLDNSIESLINMISRLRSEASIANNSANVPQQLDGGRRPLYEELLPNGLNSALQVRPPAISHPLITNVTGAEVRPTTTNTGIRASPIHGYRSGTSRAILHVDYGLATPAFDPRDPFGEDLAGVLELDERFRDGTAAMWPTRDSIDASLLSTGVQSSAGQRRALASAETAASTQIVSNIHRIIEDWLIDENSESEETDNDVVSRNIAQTPSADSRSQTNDGSFQSSIMNDHRRNQRASDRMHQIPPLIEIDTPDQANEELSVLTLPQDDHHHSARNNHFRSSGNDGQDDTTLYNRGSRSPSINTTYSDGNEGANTEESSQNQLGNEPSIAFSGDSGNFNPGIQVDEGNNDDASILQDPVRSTETPISPLEDNAVVENGVIASNGVEETIPADIHAGDSEVLQSDNADVPTRVPCPPGYDEEVFYSLPDFMQQEILEQQVEESGTDQLVQLAEAAGYDLETLNALPENIRQEVLDQARREQQAISGQETTTAQAQEIDNASFIASLAPELRAEVLMTADADFLATLPPDLVAEAQAVRERAASSWQHRELNSHAAGADVMDRAAHQAGDEEYFSEDDEEDDYLRPDRTDGRDRSNNSAVIRQLQSGNGKMMVMVPEKPCVEIPKNLLVEVFRLLVQLPEDVSVSLVMHRLLQNVSNGLEGIDLILKTLIALLTSHINILQAASVKLCEAPDAVDLVSLLDSCVPTPSSRVQINTAHTGDRLELRPASIHRILFILTQLFHINPTYVYLTLAGRTPTFAILDNTKNVLEEAFLLAESKASIADDIVNVDKVEQVESRNGDGGESVLIKESDENRVSSPRRNAPISSEQFSLLELLITLFAKPLFDNNGAELDLLAHMVDLVTLPLDGLTDKAEMKASKGYSSVPIPMVQLSRESLSALCDVLLSDLCSKRIFLFVTSSISRLAKISSNNLVILELISEVIADLSEQCGGKLGNLHTDLVEKRKQHLSLTTSSSFGSLAGIDFVDRQLSTSNSVKAKSPTKIPTNLLTVGEVGGRFHERFLRLIQTLQSISEKTGRSLSEVIPFKDLFGLWSNLEGVLAQLRYYLVVDENTEETATIRAQTTLMSVLNKLLPTIEAFFLVHAHDYLTGKVSNADQAFPNKPSDSTKAITDKKEGASDSINSTEANNGKVMSSLEIRAMVDYNASVPGQSYRTTAEYTANNLSLFNDGNLPDDRGLQSNRSFRRMSSFPLSYSSSFKGTMNGISSKAQKLISFTQAHKLVLNLIIKSKPSLLEESLSPMVRIVQLRPSLMFDNKRKYFFSKLKSLRQSPSRRGIHLQIRRNQIFEDSFHQMRSRTIDEFRGRLQVNFHSEEGVDAGGLTREWYLILSREIFNPNYALFTVAADGATFQPNPLSVINTNHLEYFKFVGRVIGKAICDEQLMDAHFTRSFYKHMIGMPVEFSDIEATEPDYYKTLKQLMDTPLEILMMDLTFTAEIHRFGKLEVVDLIPNGRNIAVTDENKGEYIRLIAHHRMSAAIRSQIDSFLSGLYELLPPELISIFSPTELELLICGLPDIKVSELRAHTDYHQYKASDEMIIWFWEILEGFNREERASFLLFVTGTSKVPLGGFANLQGMRGAQKFSIHKAYGDAGLLPSAHTCFNQLDLPIYSSREELRDKLLMAINEGSEGFGFA